MRIALCLLALVFAGFAAYSYAGLVDARHRLDLVEKKVNAIAADYASAGKANVVISNLQSQINGLRFDLSQIAGDYASARKVEGRLDELDRQIKNQTTVAANLTSQQSAQQLTMNDNMVEVRGFVTTALSLIGHEQLIANKPVEAERTLRLCVWIREKDLPNNWVTFNAKSMLGESLLAQKKFADAEPLLLSGYRGMKERQQSIAVDFRVARLSDAASRLVALYDAWEKQEQAKEWRAVLEAEKVPAK